MLSCLSIHVYTMINIEIDTSRDMCERESSGRVHRMHYMLFIGGCCMNIIYELDPRISLKEPNRWTGDTER